MKKILCLGELLLRLSPSPNGAWLTNKQMPVFLGGSELNVATALAGWEIPVSYFTALPDNSLSHDIASYVSQKGIDTRSMVYAGERIGLYYLQQGTDMKHRGTQFDRANSSFACLPTGMVRWEEVLKDISWLHFSAITPGLSASSAALCREVLEVAASKNITISVDLNERSLLWKYGPSPASVMPELVQYCDVVMGNIWSAHTLLNIPLDTNIHQHATKETYLQHASNTALLIQERYPKCTHTALTFRFDEGKEGIRYYAALHTGEQQYVSKEFHTDRIIDKVGSGDCFMAGLVYGMTTGMTHQDCIHFAAAAAFGKFQEAGDHTSHTISDIQHIIHQYE